ncbi:MAG: hypothetical protein MJ178_09015 [Treponemataceae bacterium]|nr:hypothetical protein [Treponemataceae bacterium]
METDYKKIFDKINLHNVMTNDLVSFAAGKYGPQFAEYVDMNCGAIPEGTYETLIDQENPKPFIDMYTSVAIKRISLCCQKILELGPGYDKVLANYFFNAGQNLGLPHPSNEEEQRYLVDLCLLEGGDDYKQYMEPFVQGLFAD